MNDKICYKKEKKIQVKIKSREEKIINFLKARWKMGISDVVRSSLFDSYEKEMKKQ